MKIIKWKRKILVKEKERIKMKIFYFNKRNPKF